MHPYTRQLNKVLTLKNEALESVMCGGMQREIKLNINSS